MHSRETLFYLTIETPLHEKRRNIGMLDAYVHPFYLSQANESNMHADIRKNTVKKSKCKHATKESSKYHQSINVKSRHES